MMNRLCLAVIILILPFPAWASEFEAKVTRVVDGDTLDFEAEILNVVVKGTCRMLDYDAPESYVMEHGKWRETGDPEAAAATRRLGELVGDGPVRIRAGRTDRYGRWLCEVWLPNGMSINKTMRDFLEY